MRIRGLAVVVVMTVSPVTTLLVGRAHRAECRRARCTVGYGNLPTEDTSMTGKGNAEEYRRLAFRPLEQYPRQPDPPGTLAEELRSGDTR